LQRATSKGAWISGPAVTASRGDFLVCQGLDSIAKMNDVDRLYRFIISGLPSNYNVGTLPVYYMAQTRLKSVEALISSGADVHEKLARGNIPHSLLTTVDNRKSRKILCDHASPTDLAPGLLSVFFQPWCVPRTRTTIALC